MAVPARRKPAAPLKASPASKPVNLNLYLAGDVPANIFEAIRSQANCLHVACLLSLRLRLPRFPKVRAH